MTSVFVSVPIIAINASKKYVKRILCTIFGHHAMSYDLDNLYVLYCIYLNFRFWRMICEHNARNWKVGVRTNSNLGSNKIYFNYLNHESFQSDQPLVTTMSTFYLTIHSKYITVPNYELYNFTFELYNYITFEIKLLNYIIT